MMKQLDYYRKKLVYMLFMLTLSLVYYCATVKVYAQQEPADEHTLKTAVVIWHGPENKRQVALTFDDGPSPRFTPEILKILAAHNVKATFFLMGDRAVINPELVKEIAAAGHEIGSHTMSHPEAPKTSPDKLKQEVDTSLVVLENLTHKKVKYFRPPYGYYNEFSSACADKGLTMIMWSIDPNDWKVPPAHVIAERVLHSVKPGSIILLHDGGNDRIQTVHALEIILKDLKERNLTPVTLSELLQ